jgi:glycosyltransferase involved in cell wall biosynthesis
MPRMALPLVSVVIPTHERPHYLSLALQSVLDQTYPNLDIVVSDNSQDDTSREAVAALIANDSRVRYFRVPERAYAPANFWHALDQARGKYLNFLMDDDLFHPRKIERMVGVLEANDDIAFVTSSRQLIDGDGQLLPAIPGTYPLFEADAAVSGEQLGDRMLLQGSNLIGEPTTVLLRREQLGAGMGYFLGRQYFPLGDVATWLSLMHGRRVAVLHDKLSYFRLHAGQDQRRPLLQLDSSIEWTQLQLDARDAGLFLRDTAVFREALSRKLSGLFAYAAERHAMLREANMPLQPLHAVLRRAMEHLFHD